MGLTVLPNPAREGSVAEADAGRKVNLSLIMSLLQRAGVQDEAVQARALRLHDQLAAAADPLGEMLSSEQQVHEHGKVFEALALHIFGTYGWRAAPQLLIMKAGERGAMLLYDPVNNQGRAEVDPATISHDTAVFIESPGGFNLLANTSGRPWTSVLAQLQILPHRSDEARGAAWVRHCVQGVEVVDVPSLGNTLEWKHHAWTRGMQMRLEPLNINPNVGAVTLAQAMAGAQFAVDTFWERAKILTNDLGHRSVSDRYLIHTLTVPLSAGYEDETNDQYTAELHVVDGRIIRLTMSNSRDGDMVVVDYEDPRLRPVVQTAERQTLWHLDDLDAFDKVEQIVPSRQLALFLPPFAEFLLDLREHGHGMGWQEFRWRPRKEVDAYLSQAAAERGLNESVLSVVRQTIEMQSHELHRDDQKALEAFRPFAAAHGRALSQGLLRALAAPAGG